MREAVIVAAVRTPVGRCRGVLAPVPAHELGALAVKEAVRRAGINPEEIDEVIFANLMNNEINNMARMVSLSAGLPISVPGITLDRQCAASLNAVAYASILIEAGYADIIVAGGVESDSRRCYVMEKPTQPYQVAPPQWAVIHTAPGELNVTMGMSAENVAEKYGITRRECDEFSLLSHQKATRAWEAGVFDGQIVPVEVKDKKKSIVVEKDECYRPDASLEAMAALPPVFKKDGIVTAGNSSPMSDGAGAVVIMEKGKAKALGLEILAKFKAYAAAGVDPRIMGVGPIAATRKLFQKTGMTMKDIDLIELNEAFASQAIACIRELNIDMEKLNVNGGAIALGHPLAGTGAILTTKMVYELKRRGLQTGLISFCVGGGQGVSVVLERE
ncbi:thiolase family protein [Moorella sulfitireducens]|uniref:thiolase family protein n=1 Tax=Neomoorella sulfitireducens TaxID=2972948 RepID=UPI0021AC5347|nr:thiolase family protein [Moorella sulfitireducens]